MFLVELSCSDEDCEAALEAVCSLTELELHVCEDCGCCMQVLSISEHEPAEVTLLLELSLAA